MTPPAKKAVPSLSDLNKKPNQEETPTSTSEGVSPDATESEETNTPNNKKNDTPDTHIVADDKREGSQPKPELTTASKSSENTTGDENDAHQGEIKNPALSKHVTATVPNKTPSELAAETPDESAARYGIDRTITDEDNDNPRVDASHELLFPQIPSGTHLHPDIAKSTQNRGIGTTTENASVTYTVPGFDYAQEAPVDDKGIKNPPPQGEILDNRN